MGATRESNCSGGILAAWPPEDAGGADDWGGACASASPGARSIVHRIATRDLRFPAVRSGFIRTSLPAVSEPNVESTEANCMPYTECTEQVAPARGPRF